MTGLESTVKAVRPSTSSETDTLADHTATMIDNTMIDVRPESLSILTSSPNVL